MTVAALAVLALVLVLIAGATAGPWKWPDPGGDSTFTMEESATGWLPLPTVEEPPPDPADEAPPTAENPLVRWLLIGVAAVIGLLVVLLLVRLALLLRRESLPPPDPREVSEASAENLLDAPAIQEGIVTAQQALAEQRPPRDAIVQAWLALERAAGDAGAARRPSQTPTEFVAVVLTRTSADDDAVQTLRRLYTRSRFSEAEVTRRDAEAARGALERIAGSWAALEVPS